MMTKNILLLLLPLLVSCNNGEKSPYEIAYSGEIDKKYELCFSDCFKLDTTIDISAVGFVDFNNSNILYADVTTGKLNIFDTTGKFQRSVLGYGRSRREIPTTEITNFGVSDSTYLIFSDLAYYIYDSTFSMINNGYVKTMVRETSSGDVRGNNPMIYTWSQRNRGVKLMDGKIFSASSLRRIDIINEKDKYFGEGYTVLKIDIENSQPENLIGKYSSGYLKNNWEAFGGCTFDFDSQNNMYLSFEADSLVYKLDKAFNNISTYGNSGVNMNVNYRELSPSDNLYDDITTERETKGYYEKIRVLKGGEMVVRVYRRGDADMANDGLQIYRDNVLMCDATIPKGFSLAGNDGKSLYLYKMDEDNQTVSIVKAIIIETK